MPDSLNLPLRLRSTLSHGVVAIGQGSLFFTLQLGSGKQKLHSRLLTEHEGVTIVEVSSDGVAIKNGVNTLVLGLIDSELLAEQSCSKRKIEEAESPFDEIPPEPPPHQDDLRSYQLLDFFKVLAKDNTSLTWTSYTGPVTCTLTQDQLSLHNWSSKGKSGRKNKYRVASCDSVEIWETVLI